MSEFIEKLAAIEEQIKALHQKVEPLTRRAETISHESETLYDQLKKLVDEASVLRDDLADTQGTIDSILTNLAGVKQEGMQIDSRQDENRQIHESLAEMFGETFQVVTRFLDTAQRLGIVEKDKMEKFHAAQELASSIQAVKSVVEPVDEAPEAETVKSVVEPVDEAPEAEAVETVAEPVDEASEAEAVETAAEPVDEAPEAEAVDVPSPQAAFDELSEHDFAQNDMPASELSLPSLPDVTTSVSLPPVDDGEMENAEKSSAEIASQLDLPPLQLDTPEVAGQTDQTEEEEQKIEDLLNDLSKPIST